MNISNESCPAVNPNELLVPTIFFVLVLELKTRLHTSSFFLWLVFNVHYMYFGVCLRASDNP